MFQTLYCYDDYHMKKKSDYQVAIIRTEREHIQMLQAYIILCTDGYSSNELVCHITSARYMHCIVDMIKTLS